MTPTNKNMSAAVQRLPGNKDYESWASNSLRLIEEAREVLGSGGEAPFRSKLISADLSRARDVLSSNVRPSIGTIHHFACTGGTVLARAVQAQPNTRVVSEVDPLSVKSLVSGRKGFAPTDLIALCRTGVYDISSEVIVQMFLAALDVLYDSMNNTGQRLILRDHAHSRYCTNVDFSTRPGLMEIVQRRYCTNSVVSVRHPLESWQAMKENSFVDFPNESLDEYCLRYLAFLDDHSELPIVRYEEFVDHPEDVVRQLCGYLDIGYTDDWSMIMPAIKLTGDSGRSGDEVKPRKRRAVTDEMLAECRSSEHLEPLCSRLGYERPS